MASTFTTGFFLVAIFWVVGLVIKVASATEFQTFSLSDFNSYILFIIFALLFSILFFGRLGFLLGLYLGLMQGDALFSSSIGIFVQAAPIFFAIYIGEKIGGNFLDDFQEKINAFSIKYELAMNMIVLAILTEFSWFLLAILKSLGFSGAI